MLPPAERQAVQQVVERLAELLGVAASDAKVRAEARGSDADAVVDLGGLAFVVEWRRSGAAAAVATAAEQVPRYASAMSGGAIRLVAVPFMGPVGRQRCEKADVAWLDLSGNARIFAPGIRVLVDGRPNRFKRPDRPSSAFAPKSARITRWLLIHPHEPMARRQIAQATGMDEGFTSRIVARLEEDDLVVREGDGTIRPRDPDLLLDAWREHYDFSRHRIVRGHMPARSGDTLLHGLADELGARGVPYAATGLAAAWVLTRFAGFRIASVYLPEAPPPGLLDRLSFREEERGANVWLVVPNDEGVFHGAADRDRVRCVHPVQAYLDLKGHPERAGEAADQLRADLLRWSTVMRRVRWDRTRTADRKWP